MRPRVLYGLPTAGRPPAYEARWRPPGDEPMPCPEKTPVVAADGRPLARAIRVAGTVEPVFVEDIGDMPRMILSAARAGDVVITMGAGSIGAVPGKLASIEEAV